MIQNKRVLGVTLARGGSQSIQKKNIVLLSGKPLIAYTILEALASRYIDAYIVSTDDDEVAAVSRKYGARVPFRRPRELCIDRATSASALIHALEWMEDEDSNRYDIVIELMCTNPMKSSQDIDAVLKKLVETDADSVVSVMRLYDHHPARIKKITNDRLVDFCLKEKPENRRQDLRPPAYIRNGAIYAVKRDVLLRTQARYGTENSRPYVMDENHSVNIDSAFDLRVAEQLLKDSSGLGD